MKNAIVRRMDDLGRLVIPKEMRKMLKIKDGDPVEICTDNGEIILKKYYPSENANELVQSVGKGLEEVFEKICFITDTDRIIYASSKYKEAVGEELSNESEKIIREKKSLLNSKSDGGEIVSLYKGFDKDIENQLIVPILCEGDCFGAIVICDKDKTQRFSSQDVKTVRLGASVLAENFAF